VTTATDVEMPPAGTKVVVEQRPVLVEKIIKEVEEAPTVHLQADSETGAPVFIPSDHSSFG